MTTQRGARQDKVGRRAFVVGAGALAAAAPAATSLVGMPSAAAQGAAVAGLLGEDQQLPLDPVRWDTCRALARELLLVGPDNEDLKLQYLKVLIDDGLPATTNPKNVLIVGAGIAGLAAGALLKQAGHRVTIIEANANRIGGRIKTFRRGPESADAPFADENQYAEAGAMRLPDFHPLTLALVDKLGLPRRLFYNVDVVPGTGATDAVPPVTYHSFTGETWQNGPTSPQFQAPDKALGTYIHVHGKHTTRKAYTTDPRTVNGEFGIHGDDRAQTAAALLDEALDFARNYYSDVSADGTRVDKQLAERIDGWARLIYDLDAHSMWHFLRERARLAEPVVHAIGILENLTSRMALSFVHSFLTRSLVSTGATYWELIGGTATLPYALLPEVQDDVRMNRRMIRLEHDDHGVRIETVSEENGDDARAGKLGDTEVFEGDLAIVTVPFSALRHVEVNPHFSIHKRRAVGELHYDSSTKVLLEFSRRWWEFTEDDWRRELDAIEVGLYDRYQTPHGVAPGTTDYWGADAAVDAAAIPDGQRSSYTGAETEAAVPNGPIFGGGSVSDEPNRFTYYPSHALDGSAGGVVLASYTWAEEANRWDSLDDEERYAYALRGVQRLHGKRVEVFYTGRGKTQSWLRNRYACGEAAVFNPGQFTELHPAIATVEGRVHFAGEHTSLKHSWIEGALESAVRVALEVNTDSAD